MPLLLSLILLSGCSRTVNADDYDQVTQSMSYSAVVALLGQPDKKSSISLGPLGGLGGLKSEEALWKSSGDLVVVRFVNDQVTVKTWLKKGHY